MNTLKKAFYLLILSVSPSLVNAQANLSVEPVNVLINPSITVGWYDYGYGLDVVNILPPVGLNFEVAAFDFVTLGLEAEYGTRRYKDFFFTTGSNEYRYQYKALGFRASFHYLDLLKHLLDDKIGGLNSEKLDFYVGVSSGILITQSTQTWNDGVVATDHERKTFDSSLQAGYMAGFRYYFSSSFGAFAETGRNTFGWGKIGLTLKL